MRYLFILLILGLIGCTDNSQYKAGWSDERIDLFANACVDKLKNNFYKNNNIDENDKKNRSIVRMVEVLAKKFKQSCVCVGKNIAKKYSYSAIPSHRNEVYDYIHQLTTNGECKPKNIQ